MSDSALSRRTFIASTLCAAALPALGLSGPTIGPGSGPPATFKVVRLCEWFGDGEYGDIMGVFAHGHIDPTAFVRKIDMDDIVDMIGADEADGLENDPIRLIEVEKRLCSQVTHLFARWGNPDCSDCDSDSDCDCDYEKCLLPAMAGDAGAFPVTQIDLYPPSASRNPNLVSKA